MKTKPATPDELRAWRRAYIPAAHRDTAQHARCKLGTAEAWTWTDGKTGKPCAVAFFGASAKPYSGRGSTGSAYTFRTPDARRAWVAECFHRAALHAERIAKTRAEKAERRAKPHGLKVGDILRSSWGYDQTNIDYYEVTRLIGAQMVEIREIAARAQETGFMSGDSVPAPGQYIGKPERRRVSDHGERDSVKVSECAHAYLMRPTVVGGVKCYGPSHWTAYA